MLYFHGLQSFYSRIIIIVRVSCSHITCVPIKVLFYSSIQEISANSEVNFYQIYRQLHGASYRTNVPQIDQMFVPDWRHLKKFEERDRIFKAKQKEDYDRRHRVRDVSPIPVDTPVWINTRGTQTPGTVSRLDGAPRSYWLQTPSGEVRRNRRDVIVQAGRDVTVQAETTESQGQQAETTESQGPLEESQGYPPLPARAIETSTRTIATRSRTGTIVKALFWLMRFNKRTL